ncbi:MAG: lactate utilization protein [Bryobacteraceae bacterium]|nr:lactate utilization protein [Bryobacteraceae bacterium]MDW8378989.1 lactate utilization protein [Bryobacterales bacterium]
MNGRDALLAEVRQALGRQKGQAPPPPPPPRIVIPELSLPQRLALFRSRLEELGGKVLEVPTLAAARQAVAELLDGPAVASNSLVLAKAGIPSLPRVVSGLRDAAALREACRNAAYGITSADFALAETGTLVLMASAQEDRLVSLLPPVHIAVVPVSRLLSGLDELYNRKAKPAEETSAMILITGPSRSADIEMILVRGVHGPRLVQVIFVDEDVE